MDPARVEIGSFTFGEMHEALTSVSYLTLLCLLALLLAEIARPPSASGLEVSIPVLNLDSGRFATIRLVESKLSLTFAALANCEVLLNMLALDLIWFKFFLLPSKFFCS